MTTVLTAGVVLATFLGGCSTDTGADENGRSGGAEPADLTTCKDDAEAADAPFGDAFPADWPFPAETVVHHVEDRGADGTIVSGVSTSSFTEILAFLNQDVVSAGFRIEGGETEEHDAEAEWRGNGFHGRWTIRESATCPGETVIQVLSAAD